MLYQHHCHKCDYDGPSKFVHSGPHLKQICGGCGFYIRFADKTAFLSIPALRQEIWAASNGEPAVIETAKYADELMRSGIIFSGMTVYSFAQEITGLHAKLWYYRLYLEVIKITQITHNEHERK